MATGTDKQSKTDNLFNEDITSIYQLTQPTPRSHAYELQVMSVLNQDEQYMIEKFHEQSVAIEGRSAIDQLVVTRVGEMATNAAFVMATTMENVERVEGAARLGRLSRRLQEFDNRLLDQTAKHILETDSIATRTMHEDMRRNIYRPVPPPPSRQWKGVIPAIATFLFGEE